MFKSAAIFWLTLAVILLGQAAISIFSLDEMPIGFTPMQLLLAVLPPNLVFVTLGAAGFLAGIGLSRAVPSPRLAIVSAVGASVVVIVVSRFLINTDIGPGPANYIAIGVLFCASLVAALLVRRIGNQK